MMNIKINGEVIDAVRMCNPAEANTFDEVFNTANAPVCLDASSVNGFTQAFTQSVWDDYSAAEHAMGMMLLIRKGNELDYTHDV